MSSSTNSRPVFKQTQGSKAAIIRPVNRRDVTKSYVRIDAVAENVIRPNMRALQLEDYVAQIRGVEAQPEIAPRQQEAALESQTAAPQAAADSSEMSESDHIDVLRTVAKLDAGQQWIAENNRAAALSTFELTDNVPTEIPFKADSQVQPAGQPLSQEMVNDIAKAIASVLTDKSETELDQKITEAPTELAAAPAEPPTELADDTLKLSPEIPRQSYTLPVSEHCLIEDEDDVAEQETFAADPTNTISLTAAAWDVPAFRWPEVSSQILQFDGLLSHLAKNCREILSPFGKTIAVTAPARGQGTSTMATTLARLFASSGKRVLLVDADIANPTLSKTIGLEGVSWYTKKDEQDPIGESIVHGQESGICVLPLGGPIANVAAHSTPIFDQLEAKLDQVRSEFDLIIIDAGPVWQIVDEISSNGHLIDVAMLVNQDTQSYGFSEARERLMDRGIFKFIATQNSSARRAG
jgi:Mrp family chromosome partitioning ATPase